MNTTTTKAMHGPVQATGKMSSQPQDCGGATMPQRARQGRNRRRQRLSGVTSIEYALLGSLIAATIVSSISAVGQSALALWARVAAEIAKVM